MARSDNLSERSGDVKEQGPQKRQKTEDIASVNEGDVNDDEKE